MLPAEAKDEEVKTALKNLVDSLKILEDELKQRGSMYFAGWFENRLIICQ